MLPQLFSPGSEEVETGIPGAHCSACLAYLDSSRPDVTKGITLKGGLCPTVHTYICAPTWTCMYMCTHTQIQDSEVVTYVYDPSIWESEAEK